MTEDPKVLGSGEGAFIVGDEALSAGTAAKVLVADDHQLLRDAITGPLRSAGFDVLQASNFSEVVSKVSTEEGIDLVLLDILMPGMDGLGSVEELVERTTPIPLVVFSGNVSKDFVSRAIEMGAQGYIPKSLPLRALPNTIRLILSGVRFLPYDEFAASSAVNNPSEGRHHSLTDVELKVLYGATIGQLNKEIAADLSLTEVAVKMYMRSICNKLGARNRTHAAMIAKQRLII